MDGYKIQLDLTLKVKKLESQYFILFEYVDQLTIIVHILVILLIFIAIKILPLANIY